MRPVVVPPALAGQLFTTAMARAAGLEPEQLRTRAVRRVLRDVYCDARLACSDELRYRAVELLAPDNAVWAGEVALRAWDLPAPIDAPSAKHHDLHIVVPAPSHRRRPVAGFRVSVCALTEEDVVERGGRRVLAVPRLFTLLAASWTLPDLVALLDAAARRGLVSMADLQRAVARMGRAPGARRARAALDLLDAASRSPMESRVRVRLVLAGVPRPASNYRVFAGEPDVDGTPPDFLGEVDLAWVQARVLLEYDGAQHAGARARSNDNAKRRLLEQHGWTVIVVTAWDYHHAWDAVVRQVQAALAT